MKFKLKFLCWSLRPEAWVCDGEHPDAHPKRQPRIRRKAPSRKILLLAVAFAVMALVSSVVQMAEAAAWFAISPMNIPRDSHTATVLTNAKVLIVGGRNNGVSPVLANTELFDPGTQLFTHTAALAVARESHTATLLPNGRVLRWP